MPVAEPRFVTASLTKDLQLVCRHSACDLQFTTDLVTAHEDMNKNCTKPFVPGSGEKAVCCTFDFTLEQLGRLCAQMESNQNPQAKDYKDYLSGPPPWRTGAVAQTRCHPLVSYDDYLALLKRSGYHAIPELKGTMTRSLKGFLHQSGKSVEWLAAMFARKLKSAGFGPLGAAQSATNLYGVMQTFDPEVAKFWKSHPDYKEMSVEYMWQSNESLPCKSNTSAWSTTHECTCVQAEYGDGDCGNRHTLNELNALGVDMFSPPITLLVETGANRSIIPSSTATLLRKMGVNIGSWSFERQGCTWHNYSDTPKYITDQEMAPCGHELSDWNYYQSTDGKSAFQHEDILLLLDTLFTGKKLVWLNDA